jgi:serine/threonine-protein kinase
MGQARIKLTVAAGDAEARQIVFERPANCVIGRAFDCDIQLNGDDQDEVVSRHHCILEIHPPIVHVRDLDSLNGTFVNGLKIGQRREDASARIQRAPEMKTRMLADGDELRIGGTRIHVDIFADTDEFRALGQA